MRLARTGIIAAGILSVASVAFAQKPDFSGSWTVDPSASQAPPARGGGGRMGGRGGGMTGGPMVVKQAGDTLTIERTMGQNKVTTTYKLDGTESENRTMGRDGEMVSKSTAKWDGDKLTITTKQAGRGGAERVSTQVWELEGGNLTVESTRTGRGGNPMTTKRVYKKTT